MELNRLPSLTMVKMPDKTRPNILILYRRLVPLSADSVKTFHGGAQRVSMQLATHFATTENNVFFGSDDYAENAALDFLAEHGVVHVRFPFDKYREFLTCIIKLFVFVRKNDIDVIHAHDRRSALYAWIVSSCSRAEMVYTAHNVFPDKKFTKNFLGKNIVTVSHAVKQDLVKRHSISAERIRVIHNGVSVKRYEERNQSCLKKKYGLHKDDRLIATIARLSEQKGHFYLVEAISELKQHFPEIKLLLVGSGEEEDELKRRVDGYNLKDYVIFCGSQSNPTLFYEVCEFSVLPSLWEGLPTTAIESLQFGKPVVATRVGGITEVISDKETGLLVPPADPKALAEAMRAMLADPEQTVAMGKQGQKRAREKFAPKRMFKEYEDYFNKLLAERKRGLK